MMMCMGCCILTCSSIKINSDRRTNFYWIHSLMEQVWQGNNSSSLKSNGYTPKSITLKTWFKNGTSILSKKRKSTMSIERISRPCNHHFSMGIKPELQILFTQLIKDKPTRLLLSTSIIRDLRELVVEVDKSNNQLEAINKASTEEPPNTNP